MFLFKKIYRNIKALICLIWLAISTLLIALFILIVYVINLIMPKRIHHAMTKFLSNGPDWWVFINKPVFVWIGCSKWRYQLPSNLNPNGIYLVMCNHQSWADIIVLNIVLSKIIAPLKYFMKKELAWQLPIAGLACKAVGFPFLSRHSRAQIKKNPELKNKDKQSTIDACNYVRRHPASLMIFPEGSRFRMQKHKQQHCSYKHLLKPKTGGVAMTLNGIGKDLAGILDITINFGVPVSEVSMWDFLEGCYQNISLNIEALPFTEELLGDYENDKSYRLRVQNWLNQRWNEKDAWLEKAPIMTNTNAIKQLKLATRESPMAMQQAQHVKQLLEQHFPGLNIELYPMTTLGDQRLDKPIKELDNKSVFVKTIEQALLNNEADFAVHCVKDMSVYPIPGLTIPALLKRDDPRDALLNCEGLTLAELPEGAIIGTGSPRRIAQLKNIRPDLKFTAIRGNVNTRIKKLEEGEVDALMLSYCGLLRINKTDYITQLFEPEDFISAVGQGALSIQCRENDFETQKILHQLHDRATGLAVAAEQALVHRLNGDCHTPIGVYAKEIEQQLYLDACVGDDKTGAIIYTKATGPSENAQRIGIAAADDLIAKGANHIVTPESE